MADFDEVAQAEITLTSDRLSTDATFDAVLSRPTSGMDMYRLTLKLRLCLTEYYKIPPVVTNENRQFWIIPWDANGLHYFLGGAKFQANLWNDRFWLKPPAGFTAYDTEIMGSNQSFRPYIACALDVDFISDRSRAHRVIDVYNLDITKLPGHFDPSTVGFRSDALTFDSFDNYPRLTPYMDDKGHPMKHYVIAHEIGHAIGQPHIGVMRKLPACVEKMDDLGDDGQNEMECYGVDQLQEDGKNIMGGGSVFAEDNAISWKWAIHQITGHPLLGWQVLTSKPANAGEWITR